MNIDEFEIKERRLEELNALMQEREQLEAELRTLVNDDPLPADAEPELFVYPWLSEAEVERMVNDQCEPQTLLTPSV